MSSILVQRLDLGLNALVSENMIDPRGAAKGTENILYEYGIMRTPSGFAKVDLSATGLNSQPVLRIIPYAESDRTSHVLAVTTQKIYDHNRSADQWDDKTGTALSSDIDHPVSFAEIAHNDTNIYLDDDSTKAIQYYHLVVCDGGLSNIKRWAGKYESTFLNVAGAGGYHDGTTHRALQVGSYKSRLILVSPLEYSTSSASWIENKQRIRWPVISKLQTWTGTGSGFVDLMDTGGENIWSLPLGNSYIIYQNNSIWELGYVGGTLVFSPMPLIPDLGLLSYNTITSRGNIHYFVGNDYNVYAYYGGSVKQRIGDNIHKFLQDDLDPTYNRRCRMLMGDEHKWLYIFIVPDGSIYITKAYIMNMITGAWSVRDFSNVFGSGDGITAVSLAGAESYDAGDTYNETLQQISLYDAADDTATTSGDVTERYGDVLFDGTGSVLDWSTLSAVAQYDFSWKAGEVAFSAGGLKFCFSYANDPTKLVDLTTTLDGTTYSGIIIRIDDGSASDNMPNGSHYYMLTDICSRLDVGTDYTVTMYVQPCESTGTGIADTPSDTPVLGGDTTATLYDPSGETYNTEMDTVLVAERIMLGDATGFVYQMDLTSRREDNNSIVSRHLTPVIDLGAPENYKRWDKLSYTAKATVAGSGGIKIRFRTGDFDTTEVGWVDVTQSFGSDWELYNAYINRSSRQIQFAFENASGATFELREAALTYIPEDNR